MLLILLTSRFTSSWVNKPEERAATRKAKAKKKKEDEETMREMEKYQEDRRIERERKYGLKPQKWAKFLGAGQEAAY